MQNYNVSMGRRDLVGWECGFGNSSFTRSGETEGRREGKAGEHRNFQRKGLLEIQLGR